MSATERPIIVPIDRQLIRQELTSELFVRKTNKSNNEIYAFRAAQVPQIMRGVGRLREESFRAGGGGAGLECGVDKYDLMDGGYVQLIVWSPELEKIMGGYRYIFGGAVLRRQEQTDALVTPHMFGFSEEFVRGYPPYTIELGYSFVSQEFQTTWAGLMSSIYTLDSLWDGLGALTVICPEIKYFFGKVTMYKTYSKYCRNLVLKFMEIYFGDEDHLVFPMNPVEVNINPVEIDRLSVKNDLKSDYRTLKAEVRKHNISIPPLFNTYMSLTPKVRIFGTAIDDELGDVEETGSLTPIADIIPEKKEHHIDTYQQAKQVAKAPLLMALANELGAAGERAAQRYLLSRHIRLLEVNWRDPPCKIDVIAFDGRRLLVIEVKSRMEYTATSPLDTADQAKAHQMMLGGMRYVQRMCISLPIRYDVIEALYCPASDLFEIKYHKGYSSAEEIALQETLPHGFIQPWRQDARETYGIQTIKKKSPTCHIGT